MTAPPIWTRRWVLGVKSGKPVARRVRPCTRIEGHWRDASDRFVHSARSYTTEAQAWRAAWRVAIGVHREATKAMKLAHRSIARANARIAECDAAMKKGAKR